MALPNLSGSNIQDTFQRVLQTDNGTLRDGTGSLVILTNITASGDISASNFIYSKQLNIESAATFGSAKVINNFSVNGEFFNETGQGLRFAAPLTASNDISASGTGIFNELQVSQQGVDGGISSVGYPNTLIRFSGDTIIGNSGAYRHLLLDHINGSVFGFNGSPVTVHGNSITLTGPVTASGIISASGNIKAPNFTTPKGGYLDVNTGQIKSSTSNNNLEIDGTDGSSVIFNDSEADVDVRIRGSENGFYYFKADAATEKVGIGGDWDTITPGEALTIHGNISASGTITATSFIGTMDGGSF